MRVGGSGWGVTLVRADVCSRCTRILKFSTTAGFESLCSEVCLPFAGEGHNLFLCHLQF